MKEITEYLWEGLNLEKYSVVAIWPQNKKNAVILMKKKNCELASDLWCIEYLGSGYYFDSIESAFSYCKKRNFRTEIPERFFI